jgi:hypothetical protein
LSKGIRSGSFFGEIPKTDRDKWQGTVYPAYFAKSYLSKGIRSGSFFGEIPKTDKDKWQGTVYPAYFAKPNLSKAIQAGSFIPGGILIVPADPSEVLNIHYPGYPTEFPRKALSKAIRSGSFFVGEIPKTDLDKWERSIYPVFFPKPALARSIQAGSFTPGGIFIIAADPNEVLNIHYPGYPTEFPRQALSKAIRSGSFFVGEIPKTDKDKWQGTVYPAYFAKPALSKAIQAGSFILGGTLIVAADPNEVLNIHYPGYPTEFPRKALSKAIRSGSFFVGEIPKTDKDKWQGTVYPAYFARPNLLESIQAGSFMPGGSLIVLPDPNEFLNIHYPGYPSEFARRVMDQRPTVVMVEPFEGYVIVTFLVRKPGITFTGH